MQEYFIDAYKEIETLYPDLSQLPREALPLPGFGTVFWRSFRVPLSSNGDPDFTKIAKEVIFFCEELEWKRYRYCVAILLDTRGMRLIVQPLYFKAASVADPSKLVGTKWEQALFKEKVELHLSKIKYVTLLKRVTSDLIKKYFPRVTVVKKGTRLYHGSNWEWTEVKDKPMFLSFRMEDAWVKRYVYEFELLQDVHVLDLTGNDDKRLTKECLVDFLGNNNYPYNLEVKKAIVDAFESKTQGWDLETLVFFRMEKLDIDGIESQDSHFTIESFKKYTKEAEEDPDFFDDPLTREISIFKPKNKLRLLSVENIYSLDAEKSERFKENFDTQTQILFKLGRSLTLHPATFIVSKTAKGSRFKQYSIQQDGVSICRHRFFEKKQLISALQSRDVSDESTTLCPLCLKNQRHNKVFCDATEQ